LQALLYAEKEHAVSDCSSGHERERQGCLFGALNPQGASVAAFKQPMPIELDHDFLWRVHPHAAKCTARYDLIRALERGLKESGTTILKMTRLGM
jgi:hypothetical protein